MIMISILIYFLIGNEIELPLNKNSHESENHRVFKTNKKRPTYITLPINIEQNWIILLTQIVILLLIIQNIQKGDSVILTTTKLDFDIL